MKFFTYYHKYRFYFFLLYIGLFGYFSWTLLLDTLPAEVNATNAQSVLFEKFLPVSFVWEDEKPVFETKKKLSYDAETGLTLSDAHWENSYQMSCRLFGWIPFRTVTVHVVAPQTVLPSGIPTGIWLKTAGVLVVDTSEIETKNHQLADPAHDILQEGDYIERVNGLNITSKEQLVDLVKKSNGDKIVLTIRRNGTVFSCKITPALATSNTYKLGVWVKDDLAGIGTITYITADGTFGGLGHGISETQKEQLMEISDGSLYQTDISAIHRGEKGIPGELTGLISFQKRNYLGKIYENTPVGLFGKIDSIPAETTQVKPVEIGYKQEIQPGDAQIQCKLGQTVKRYDIKIEDVDLSEREINKSILLKVTDPELLSLTGGIVQGMSGSPIIQNGKLVGAVTHVFVNDPTKGYGIFAETMLKQDSAE